MQLVVSCVPASDGIAVDPCGVVDGVAMVPKVVPLVAQGLDYSGLGPLFSWVVSFVLIVFVVGLTVGAIMRVVRSA